MAVLRINLDWGSPWNPIVVAPWVAASRKVKMDLTPSLKHEYPVVLYTIHRIRLARRPNMVILDAHRATFCVYTLRFLVAIDGTLRVILPGEFLFGRFTGVFNASSRYQEMKKALALWLIAGRHSLYGVPNDRAIHLECIYKIGSGHLSTRGIISTI
ncbi:hypothetical protein V1478_008292 [Vespula squamosa]|uniref:Uncharacterized protein n=1 Tax=Vespula squamosa TaxID=30214 RepID=A0ABD2AYD6_VESSQ